MSANNSMLVIIDIQLLLCFYMEPNKGFWLLM